jgi:hypothetical protein
VFHPGIEWLGTVQRWAGPEQFGHVIEVGDARFRVEGDDRMRQWIGARLITKKVG